MIMGVSDAMESSAERESVMKLLMEGFCQGVRTAGSTVSGGQTILNPSPIIGGVASAVIDRESLVRNDSIQDGDYLVLTKPLGTDMAVRRYTQLHGSTSMPEDIAEIREAYDLAVRSMAHLNLAAGSLLRKHCSTGATDITGFGLLGHAENLASVQLTSVALRFFVLPCICGTTYRGTPTAGSWNVKLLSGRGVETSGGLLAAFRTLKEADAYIADIRRIGGTESWVVGRGVEKCDALALIKTLPGDESLIHGRYNSSRIHTIAIEEISTSTTPQASKEDTICVLEVSASDLFLRENIESEETCRYNQEELAKRLM
ncbi:selenophosphate synthetase [Perkinsela sp. CCAP 1560/4]|nr:selenophosphate synthetase [Perkinsela sp. CCAP 1560/4]KNH09058.1 selenophosphate synthetase [Perkinsela sp. CCAP 1560/4]|eukprot:KNH06783.1 selenophosphate synthetase [Perkinsela sp. CCAP 1560/4]